LVENPRGGKWGAEKGTKDRVFLQKVKVKNIQRGEGGRREWTFRLQLREGSPPHIPSRATVQRIGNKQKKERSIEKRVGRRPWTRNVVQEGVRCKKKVLRSSKRSKEGGANL